MVPSSWTFSAALTWVADSAVVKKEIANQITVNLLFVILFMIASFW